MPEGGGSVHVCHKCRWAFSNPHPSPKKRAAHKKQCGRINGYPTISSLESDGEGAVGSLGSGSIAKMNLEEELGLGDERNLGNSDVVIKEIFDVASHNSLEEVVNTFDGKILGQDETINDNKNPPKDDDIAARQLGISIESQDNTLLDCSAMATSTLQAKSESDVLIGQKSTIYEEDLHFDSKHVLSEDSKPPIISAISDSNLHMMQYESGEEPRKTLQQKLNLHDKDSVNHVVNLCSPAIVECSDDVAKANLIGQELQDCENLHASITYPCINVSGTEIDIPQNDGEMDHVTLFTPLVAKSIDKPNNQSVVYELESAQIKSVDEVKCNISCCQNEENVHHLNEEGSQNEDIMLNMSHAGVVNPDTSFTSFDAETLKQPDNQSKVHELESTQMQIRSVELDNDSCIVLSCSSDKEKSIHLDGMEGANEVHVVNVSHDVSMDSLILFTSSLNQPDNQSVDNEQESTQIQVEFTELVKDNSIIPISPPVKEKDINLDEAKCRSGANVTYAVECNDSQNLSFVRDVIEVCKEYIQTEEVNDITENIRSDKLTDNSVILRKELLEDDKVDSNEMDVSVIQPQVEEETSGNKDATHLALSPEMKSDNDNEIENFTMGNCEVLISKRMNGCVDISLPNDTENDSTTNKSVPSSVHENSEMQKNQNLSSEFELDAHGNETNFIINKVTHQNLQNLGIGNDEVERDMEATESISSPRKNGIISFVEIISEADVIIPKIDVDDFKIRSQNPTSNGSVFPLEVEYGNGKSEPESSDLRHLYDQLDTKQPIGIVSAETIPLPVSDPTTHDDTTNTCFFSEEIVLSKENQPLGENSVTDGKEYSSTTSTDASDFFDASDDIVGQTESTECHSGSASERTEATIANPVNVANQREEPPIESNHSITEGQLSCEILSVKTDGHSNFSTTQDAKNCSENKKHDEEEEEAQENNKTEEIKSRVVTWQNVKDVIIEESKKPHVALKNLLGETNKEDSSSKHTKRNSLGEMFSPPREKTTHSSSQQPHPEQNKIQASTVKEQPTPQGSPARVTLINAEEVQKEWNSPARLPPINKNTKGGKTKGKPQWTPFMCCSSAVKSVI